MSEERKFEIPGWAIGVFAGLIGGGASGTALGSLGTPHADRTPEVLARLEVVLSKLDDLGRRVETTERIGESNRVALESARLELTAHGKDIQQHEGRLKRLEEGVK